jgi:hypothetical protein
VNNLITKHKLAIGILAGLSIIILTISIMHTSLRNFIAPFFGYTALVQDLNNYCVPGGNPSRAASKRVTILVETGQVDDYLDAMKAKQICIERL